MGFEALFAGLAELLAPAAEAAPAAFGAAEAAAPTAEAGLAAAESTFGAFSPATFAAETAATAAVPAGAEFAAGGLIPEATGAGVLTAEAPTIAGLPLAEGGSALGPAGAGVAGATPTGLGGGFSGVLGTGIGGSQFGDLSALLGPTDPLATSFNPGLGSSLFANAPIGGAVPGAGIPQGLTATAFDPLAQAAGPQFGPYLGETPFATPSDLAMTGETAISPTSVATEPTTLEGAFPGASRGITGAATEVAGAAPPFDFPKGPVVPEPTLPPPSYLTQVPPSTSPFAPTPSGELPRAVYPPTEVASTPAAAPAAPAAETAATTAAAAASPNLLTQYGPLALGGAGLGLNIARGMGTPTATPTAAPIGQAPATDALAQTAPAMDAGQMKQQLLNMGMSSEQADAYIAQAQARLNSQVASGNTDALSSGLITAG